MQARGSQSLQNLVVIIQRYCRPAPMLKAGYVGNIAKKATSSQSEGHSSKWLIWLVFAMHMQVIHVHVAGLYLRRWLLWYWGTIHPLSELLFLLLV